MTCCIRSYSAASDSSRKKCSRVEATKNYIDQTRINFSNSINISYFNLSKRWIERARRFFSLFYDNLIYFFFYFRLILFVYSLEVLLWNERVVIEIFIWFWFITSRVLFRRKKEQSFTENGAMLDGWFNKTLSRGWNCS